MLDLVSCPRPARCLDASLCLSIWLAHQFQRDYSYTQHQALHLGVSLDWDQNNAKCNLVSKSLLIPCGPFSTHALGENFPALPKDALLSCDSCKSRIQQPMTLEAGPSQQRGWIQPAKVQPNLGQCRGLEKIQLCWAFHPLCSPPWSSLVPQLNLKGSWGENNQRQIGCSRGWRFVPHGRGPSHKLQPMAAKGCQPLV